MESKAETSMGLFRNDRSITVDARKRTKEEMIAADLGFINIRPCDWVNSGEDGESYILRCGFFRRTFSPIEGQRLSRESGNAKNQGPPASDKTFHNLSGRITGRRVRAHRTRGLVRPARRRNSPMHSIHERRRYSGRSESFARPVFAVQRNPKVNHIL